MKRIFLTAFLVLGLLGSAWADAISKEDALKAVATFEQSPLSDEGEAAAAVITQFASESDAIKMTLTEEIISWLGDGENAPYRRQRAVLLGAYFAGNVKSQLNGGKAVDDPYSGLVQVVATYHQLRQADPGFKLPEIEKIEAMKEKSQLRAHVDRVSGDH